MDNIALTTKVVIDGPIKLDLASKDDRKATLDLISLIELYSIVQKQPIRIDLSKVIFATAPASVLIFAIVNRAHLITNYQGLITFKFPSKRINPEGHRWVVQTGLSKALLSSSEVKLQKLTDNQEYFQSSCKPAEHSYSTAAMLQKNAKMNIEQFELLSSGISEAMLNVNHHAYDTANFSAQNAQIGKRWWQCSWFDPSNDCTIFIICDLGNGICNTYMDNSSVSDYSNSKIADLMREALTVGYSRFKGVGRGNGSDDIKRPVLSNNAQNDSLLILSHDVMHLSSHVNGKILDKFEPLNEKIPGTLIQWVLSPKRDND